MEFRSTHERKENVNFVCISFTTNPYNLPADTHGNPPRVSHLLSNQSWYCCLQVHDPQEKWSSIISEEETKINYNNNTHRDSQRSSKISNSTDKNNINKKRLPNKPKKGNKVPKPGFSLHKTENKQEKNIYSYKKNLGIDHKSKTQRTNNWK